MQKLIKLKKNNPVNKSLNFFFFKNPLIIYFKTLVSIFL